MTSHKQTSNSAQTSSFDFAHAEQEAWDMHRYTLAVNQPLDVRHGEDETVMSKHLASNRAKTNPDSLRYKEARL